MVTANVVIHAHSLLGCFKVGWVLLVQAGGIGEVYCHQILACNWFGNESHSLVLPPDETNDIHFFSSFREMVMSFVSSNFHNIVS